MSLLTASDKALWRLALPMIFPISLFLCWGWWIRQLLVTLIHPSIWAAWLLARRRPASFLCSCSLRMSTTGLTAQAYGAKDPFASGARAGSAVNSGAWGRRVNRYITYPLIDLALHIVGGSGRYWSRHDASRKFAGSARPRRWPIWFCWGGYSACSMLARP